MSDYSENNKRIAKNTLFLYFRMFLLMAVSLYTVRLLLIELGVEDYGIYNVVGGIVILFTFLNNAVTQSTQRYLAFYLGKKDDETLSKVFSMSINIFLLMLLVVFILSETAGLWFLNYCLVFPEERMLEVNLTYQVTIISFMFQFMQIPHRAAIIAHERMSFYAYLSIFEVFLKLGSVLVLVFFTKYRILVYSIALMLCTLFILSFYSVYCRKHFNECIYHKIWNQSLFKELTKFYGWNMLEGVGQVAATQGFNMLFNIFCSIIVNAALAICNQVVVAVSSFLTNFLVAFNPQIVKSYASGDREYFLTLVFKCSKFAFGLMTVICVPAIFYCNQYLDFWLDEVPDYTVRFVQIMMAFLLIDALSGPLWTSAQAIGRLKVYSTLMSVLLLLNIPIAYLLLKLDISPVWVIAVRLFQNAASHTARILYLRKMIAFPVMSYLYKVMLPALLTLLVSIPVIYGLSLFSTSLNMVFVLSAVSVVCLSVICYFVLLDKSERKFVVEKTIRVFHKFRH